MSIKSRLTDPWHAERANSFWVPTDGWKFNRAASIDSSHLPSSTGQFPRRVQEEVGVLRKMSPALTSTSARRPE